MYECEKLWVLRNLEKFGKSFKIRFEIENNFNEGVEDIMVCF